MYIKYPRTLHMPFSPGATSDDKMLSKDQFEELFHCQALTITEKMDGENTSMYNDHIHARSIDSNHHPSRNWVKRYHSELKNDIPDRWRICGENMFARHSISYDNLDSYFYGFAIYNEHNICLSIQETLEWFSLLGIQHVPIISYYMSYNNEWNFIIQDYAEQAVKDGKEGIVIRKSNAFHYDDFNKNVAKYVRANHVQTDKHWMHSEIEANKLCQK